MIRSKILFAAASALILATVTAGPGVAHDHHRAHGHARAAPTLVGVAAASDDFSTLVAAVQAAGLVETLNSAGPFTVFAPTNEAFNDLPAGTVQQLLRPGQRGQLTQVLTYHVVPGRITAADLTTAVRVGGGSATLNTVEGGRLTVADRGRGRLRLTDEAGAHIDIVAADVPASNGIIHAINGVLTPR